MKSRERATMPTLREEIAKDPRDQIGNSFYYKHLQKYLNLFKPEQMLFLIYDDMAKDPVGFMKEVYSFLEIDPNFVAPSTHKRVNVTFANKAYVPGLKKTLFKIRENLKSTKAGIILIKFLKIFKINLLVKQIVKWNFRKETSTGKLIVKEKLPTDIKEQLKKLYQPDVEKLGQLLNRDLSFWLK